MINNFLNYFTDKFIYKKYLILLLIIIFFIFFYIISTLYYFEKTSNEKVIQILYIGDIENVLLNKIINNDNRENINKLFFELSEKKIMNLSNLEKNNRKKEFVIIDKNFEVFYIKNNLILNIFGKNKIKKSKIKENFYNNKIYKIKYYGKNKKIVYDYIFLDT